MKNMPISNNAFYNGGTNESAKGRYAIHDHIFPLHLNEVKTFKGIIIE
ncbi:hypothetical protein JXA02_08390 [candidate division KSB1 bacterium]|nr:hypothetical protein [candidate division KSB1 bacterium]